MLLLLLLLRMSLFLMMGCWMGGWQGQASDIAIHAKDILETRQRLNEILAKHTKQPISIIGTCMWADAVALLAAVPAYNT